MKGDPLPFRAPRGGFRWAVCGNTDTERQRGAAFFRAGPYYRERRSRTPLWWCGGATGTFAFISSVRRRKRVRGRGGVLQLACANPFTTTSESRIKKTAPLFHSFVELIGEERGNAPSEEKKKTAGRGRARCRQRDRRKKCEGGNGFGRSDYCYIHNPTGTQLYD